MTRIVLPALFPALLGTGAVLLSIPFYMVGIARMRSAGVALRVSLSALLQVVVLYVLWKQTEPKSGEQGGLWSRRENHLFERLSEIGT